MNSNKESFYDHYSRSGRPQKPEAETDKEMRGRMMAADPMLNYFREKDRDKQGTQDKPVYSGPHPPNRFNIKPGHRWDGVDRSNGFEKRLLDQVNEKRAHEEQEFRRDTRDL